MTRTDIQESLTIAQANKLPSPTVSFEFFPPKTEQMEKSLWATIDDLAPLNPSFVSVTYGAGGSTREKTHAIVKRIKEKTTLTPAAHLTCVGASQEEINSIAQQYLDSGIKHIVALRGDLPTEDGEEYTPHPEGYAYATDLVSGLKSIADFEISVAGYPDTHPDASSPEDDMRHLKEKCDAGADRIITQYFFDTDTFLRFRDRATAIGITTPVVPGILAIGGYEQLIRFSAMCGTHVPQWLRDALEGSDSDPESRNMAITAILAEQCLQLRANGVDHFHFYTLNRAPITKALCRIIGKK